MEFVLSQPAPPPCDPSPRRLPAVDTGSEELGTPRRLPAVNTGSEEPGTPRRSPAIGTGSDEPGVSRAETQSTEREEIFPLQASVDVFFLQLHKPGAGVYYASTRRRGRRQQRNNIFKSTSRHSQGVCWTADWPATTRDGFD